jgi:hypothetical protein
MTPTTRKHRDTAGWICGRDPLPVTRWCDHVGDRIGFDPRSDYVEAY